MSNYKKIAKIHQLTHRERHQPEERADLGLLEKKRDYKSRSKIFRKKQNEILGLRRQAYAKNPDEYNHSMFKLRHRDSLIFKVESEQEKEDTYNQKLLMENSHINYVNMKRIMEYKQINKMQSSLHMTELAQIVDRSHKRFDKKGNEIEENEESSEVQQENVNLNDEALDKIDLRSLAENKVNLLKEIKKREYLKLARKVERHKQLQLIFEKMKVQKDLRKPSYDKPELEKKGSTASAPIYVWKYERKR